MIDLMDYLPRTVALVVFLVFEAAMGARLAIVIGMTRRDRIIKDYLDLKGQVEEAETELWRLRRANERE